MSVIWEQQGILDTFNGPDTGSNSRGRQAIQNKKIMMAQLVLLVIINSNPSKGQIYFMVGNTGFKDRIARPQYQ